MGEGESPESDVRTVSSGHERSQKNQYLEVPVVKPEQGVLFRSPRDLSVVDLGARFAPDGVRNAIVEHGCGTCVRIFLGRKIEKEKAFRLLDSRRELEALPVHPSLRTRQAKQQKEHHDVQPPPPRSHRRLKNQQNDALSSSTDRFDVGAPKSKKKKTVCGREGDATK